MKYTPITFSSELVEINKTLNESTKNIEERLESVRINFLYRADTVDYNANMGNLRRVLEKKVK